MAPVPLFFRGLLYKKMLTLIVYPLTLNFKEIPKHILFIMEITENTELQISERLDEIVMIYPYKTKFCLNFNTPSLFKD